MLLVDLQVHNLILFDGQKRYLVFASPVQSGFLPPKLATVDRNQSRTDPDIAGTEPDHLGPVFCSPWN